MAITRAVPVILLSALFSGCLANDMDVPSMQDETPAAPWSIYKTPQEGDYPFHLAFDIVHAHDVRELHTNSYGLELVGYSALQEGRQPGTLPGAFVEVDVFEDYVAVATLTGNHAFTLVDIRDLSAPRAIGHMMSSNDNWDVRFTDDGDYIFVSCQGEGIFTRSPVGQCPDYGGVPTAVGGQDYGIITVDARDKENIVPICYTPSKAVHNLETVTYPDGRVLVANHNAEIFLMQDDGCLSKVAEVPGRHDVYLQQHPITGEMLLYTGYNEMVIYNIDDPSTPIELGIGDVSEYPDSTAWHEQSPAPVTFGDVHITIGGGERSNGRPGPLTVFNTTDPRNPQAMGQWILPVPALDESGTTYEQGAYMFSEHNVEFNQWGQACIAMYHGGVWIIDVSTPEHQNEPATLGFYLPHEVAPTVFTPGHPLAGPMTASPYVWGCAWTDDGTHVVVPDMQSGLYILRGTWFEPRDA